LEIDLVFALDASYALGAIDAHDAIDIYLILRGDLLIFPRRS
jgi:hypothetical protein